MISKILVMVFSSLVLFVHSHLLSITCTFICICCFCSINIRKIIIAEMDTQSSKPKQADSEGETHSFLFGSHA